MLLSASLGVTASALADEPGKRLVIDARIAYQLSPEYPSRALADHVDGEITVGFTIDLYGRVRDPRVVAAEPAGMFDAAALGTVRPWLFLPAWEPAACLRHEQPATQSFRFRADAPEGERVEALPLVLDHIASSPPFVVRVGTMDQYRQALDERASKVQGPLHTLVPTTRVKPQFPRTAKYQGISGLVTMKFMVTERGAVKDIEVVQSDPPGLFDVSAKTALRQWKFEPPMRDGRPVTTAACQTLNFNVISCPAAKEGRVIAPGDPCLELREAGEL